MRFHVACALVLASLAFSASGCISIKDGCCPTACDSTCASSGCCESSCPSCNCVSGAYSQPMHLPPIASPPTPRPLKTQDGNAPLADPFKDEPSDDAGSIPSVDDAIIQPEPETD